jgi:hypothetical protein
MRPSMRCTDHGWWRAGLVFRCIAFTHCLLENTRPIPLDEVNSIAMVHILSSSDPCVTRWGWPSRDRPVCLCKTGSELCRSYKTACWAAVFFCPERVLTHNEHIGHYLSNSLLECALLNHPYYCASLFIIYASFLLAITAPVIINFVYCAAFCTIVRLSPLLFPTDHIKHSVWHTTV